MDDRSVELIDGWITYFCIAGLPVCVPGEDQDCDLSLERIRSGSCIFALGQTLCHGIWAEPCANNLFAVLPQIVGYLAHRSIICLRACVCLRDELLASLALKVDRARRLPQQGGDQRLQQPSGDENICNRSTR